MLSSSRTPTLEAREWLGLFKLFYAVQYYQKRGIEEWTAEGIVSQHK
jgi:hypothetical protein